MKACRGSGDIAPLILKLGTVWFFYPRGRTAVFIKLWSGWIPEAIRTFGRAEKYLVPAGIRIPDCPICSRCIN
jgi:hypothetical protein